MALSVGELFAFLKLDSTAFNSGIRVARAEMKSATGSAETMTRAVTSTERSLANAGRAGDVAAKGTARSRAAQLSAVAAAEKYDAILKRTGATIGQVALAEARLVRANEAVRASNVANAQSAVVASSRMGGVGAAAATTTGRLSKMTSGLGEALGRTAKMGLGLGAAFGAFELIKKAIDITKEANEFQRAMVQVQTNADVSATEVNKASSALLKMAGPVAAAPEELAVAWYHAKSVGLDYAKSIEVTKIAAEGARVGNADLEETMNALTSTVASGIPGVKDMGSAMGQLITIVGSGDMKLSDLNAALGTGVLVRMKQYGLSLTDVGAALATFGDNNIRGADAATLLRMSVEAMAKQGNPGKKALDGIGISADQLRKDMQSGGLNKAILDLNDHLKAAGITGNKVGGFLIDAFTKKGGGGVAVLLGQVDRLEQKFALLKDAGASFGDKWKATTETASFALARIGHAAEAAGIQLTTRLGPSIASAVSWLSVTIPNAVATLRDAFGPTIVVIGGAFVGAWKAATTVLVPVTTALANVAKYLSQNEVLTHQLIPVIVGLWAAFKGYALITLGMSKIGPAITSIGVAARGAAAGATTLATRLGPVGIAAIGIAVALSGAIRGSKMHADAVAREKDEVDQLTTSLDADKGALGAHTREVVKGALASSGAFDLAKTLGISLKDLTDAAMGNATAMAAVEAAMSSADGGIAGAGKSAKEAAANWNQFDEQTRRSMEKSTDKTVQNFVAKAKLYNELNLNSSAISKATQASKDNAAADGKAATATNKKVDATATDTRVSQLNIDTHGRLVMTLAKAGSAFDNTSAAIQRQTLASGLLKNALDALNGVAASVEQTTDQFNVGLGNLANKTSLYKDENGKLVASLDQSTVAGATNRQMLSGLIDAAKSQAQSVADQARQNGRTLPVALEKGNAALKKNEDRLRAAAKAAGFSGPAVDAMIAKLGKLAKIDIKPKKIGVETKDATDKVAWLKGQIDQIVQGKVPYLDADTKEAADKIAALQRQIDRLQGKSVTIATNTINTTHNILGTPQAKAAGGMIHGAGTGTSDSIVARVSAGEYISTAKSTQRNEGALAAGNRGATLTASFARGGVVPSFAGGGKVTGPTVYSVGSGYGFMGSYYGGKDALKDANAARADYIHGREAAAKYDDGSARKQKRDGAQTNASNAANITVGIMPPTKSALTEFRQAVNGAEKQLNAAAAAGVNPKALARIRKQIAGEVKQANAQLANLRIKVNTSDMHALKASLTGTASDARAAFQAMLADAKAAGLSVKDARRESALASKMYGAISTRNRLQDKLGSAPTAPTAYDKLATAKANLAGEKDTVRSAATGFFNISGAGGNAANSDDSTITFARMRASQVQAKNQVKLWATGIKKLAGYFGKSKAGKSYLKSLAEAGPSSLPQVEALLGAGASGIKAIIATEAQIEAAADSVAGTVGGALYGDDVSVAQAAVNLLKDQIARQKQIIEKLDNKITHGIHDGLQGLRIVIDKQGIARLTTTGNNKNGRRN